MRMTAGRQCCVRRVDLVFGMGYHDNIQRATDVLMEIADQHEMVLDEPPVMVHVDELADSSVNLFCRTWVKTKDYWTVLWDLAILARERFDAEGITTIFPQHDGPPACSNRREPISAARQ